MDKAQKYIELAASLGAVDCVPFQIGDICFDTRTLLKCMFGCKDWGYGNSCPSRRNNVSLAEYREMLSRYQWGVIVHAHDKKTSHKASLAVEGAAFADGYYFAFSLSDCALCDTCAGFSDQPCRCPAKARPAFHSVGIDVFKTVRQLGLPISTLLNPDKEEQNWYSAVFIE